MTAQILDHGFQVTCGFCHHQDNFDLFASTPNEEFEAGHYQCPSCNKAWKVGKCAPDTYVRGRRVPGKREIIEVDAV